MKVESVQNLFLAGMSLTYLWAFASLYHQTPGAFTIFSRHPSYLHSSPFLKLQGSTGIMDCCRSEIASIAVSRSFHSQNVFFFKCVFLRCRQRQLARLCLVRLAPDLSGGAQAMDRSESCADHGTRLSDRSAARPCLARLLHIPRLSPLRCPLVPLLLLFPSNRQLCALLRHFSSRLLVHPS